jgi:hypothetical protein
LGLIEVSTGSNEPTEAVPEANPRVASLHIARKLVSAHLSRFSTQSDHNNFFEPRNARWSNSPSQQLDPLAGYPGNNHEHASADAPGPEGLLGIIMDVCKLHIQDAIQDIQRPSQPARRSTFGTVPPCRERQASFLDLDSLDSEGEEGFSDTLMSQCSHIGASSDNVEEKLRPLPLQTRPRPRPWSPRSQEMSDQWSNEKEQTKTHLTEIIRCHISRHIYLIRLCRALMLYGAPTHRLEE